MKLLQVSNATSGPSWLVRVQSPKDPAIIAQLKAIPGTTWNPKDRVWEGPEDAIRLVCSILEAAGVAKVEWNATSSRNQDMVLVNVPDYLYEFQTHGSSWAQDLLVRTGGAILADEPGLGKTLQAIAAGDREGHNIVICPAIVRDKWKKEIERFSKAPSNYLVFSYEGFVKWMKTAEPPFFSNLILDEGHYCSNPKTQRAKAVRQYLRNSPGWLLVLTGTPMTTTPVKLWNILDLCWPGRFGKKWQFERRYCDGHYVEVEKLGKEVWTASGVSHLEELGVRLSELMLRRTKRQVLTELPPITWTTIEIGIPARDHDELSLLNKNVYFDTPQDQFQAMLSNTEAFKVKKAAELAREVIESGGHPLLLTTRKATAERLGEELDIPVVHGSTHTAAKRVQALDGAKAAVATMYSINTGIDLVQFDTVVFVGFDKVPSTMIQAADRLHRIGQGLPVTAYCLVALGTIDEVIRAKALERIGTFEVVTQSQGAEGDLKSGLANDEGNLVKEMLEMMEGF